MKTILELKDIEVNYWGIKALDSLSVELREGEVVALMWPNWAWKSTILKTIFWLAPLTSWKMLLDWKEIKAKAHEIIKHGIVFVPQWKRVFDKLTVRENLELWGYCIEDKSKLKARIDEVLKNFWVLQERSNYAASTLSGWQQQMLAIARWLISDPRILLLDEPSLGLSPKMVKEVFEVIWEINKKFSTSIFVVEHNIKSLLKFVDRVYVLDKGKVVINDTPENVLWWDKLSEIFLWNKVRS